MLTVAQLIALQTQNFSPPWNTQALFQRFPAKALSLKSIIQATEQQQLGCFVQLRSPSLLLGAGTYDNFQNQWLAGAGMLDPADLAYAIKTLFQPRGVSLKYVTSDGRALIVGTVASLASITAVPITQENLQDVETGIVNAGAGLGGIGALIVGISLVPEPASPLLFALGVAAIAGAAVAGAGFGAMFGIGVSQVIEGDPAPPSTSLPNSEGLDLPQPDGDSVTIPEAVVYGDIDGVDVTGLADLIAIDLAALPLGFDIGTGTGLPNIPGLDAGDGSVGGSTGGGFGDPGSGGIGEG